MLYKTMNDKKILKATKTLVWLLVLSLLMNSCQSPPNNSKFKPFSNPEIETRVEEVMSNMTLDEKLVQIEGIRPMEIMEDGRFSIEKCREVIPHGIGHFCQFSSALTMSPTELRDFVRQVQQYLLTETNTKIPAIFHEEAITGFSTQGATTFPQVIGMGCSWNPDQVEKNAASTRKNMRAAGATYALSPMMDISRTAHWGRIEESYGEDAYLTAAMGLAFVKGLQGEDFRTGVAATTKHFAGYGTQNTNTKELYEEYIMPHEVLIKLGNVKSVMPSYGKYKGMAVVANEEMLTGILREKVGFDGVVVSDYGAINLTFRGHKQAASPKEAGVMALNAGCDVELAAPICFPLLPEALEEGSVTMERIDDAVRRSLTIKAKLGLLDENPQIGTDGDLDFDPPANRKLAYESACQSIVLLKNDGILPIQKEVKKISLVGPNAATVHGLLGDYTYQSMISFWWSTPFDPENPKLVTLMEGLQAKLAEDVSLQHERGCDWSAPLESVVKAGLGDDRLSKVKMIAIEGLPQPDLNNALKISNESDVIIAAMGENIYLCGEGRERKGIKLPGEQEDFVKKLIATGKPVILVIFGGRPQVLNELEMECAAIVQAWFPGEEGGNAIADILLGNVNPSAKLCLTYPKSEDKMEVNYKDGYTAENQSMYPFGYGLSYTNYEYSDFEITSPVKISDQSISLSFKVKNTGELGGTEIVQLYVSSKDPNSTMKPIQLKGFQRVELEAGEEKLLGFKISPELLVQYIDEQWVIQPGMYEFMAGASCTDIRLRGTVELKGDKKILKNGRSVFFSQNE
ncbi:glycoside hydrolase family 3 N-terminal domain-containing protein [Bacteroidota bacterium]